MITLKESWNTALITQERELKERDYCYASELGKPLVDRFLVMKATPYTNPPNLRAKRKMFTGNVFEFIASIPFTLMGVLKEQQTVVEVSDAPLLVRGRLDFLVGGQPDIQKAKQWLASLPFDHEMASFLERIIDSMAEKWNEPHPYVIHEIKSVSEYVLDMIIAGGNIIGHDLQVYHYVRGLKLPFGIISYISKNDCQMTERYITEDDTLRQRYQSDLAELKGYLDADERPPAAPLIVYEGKFKKNFNVEYSSYLTLLYGFREPLEYSNSISGKIAAWNRVLKRMKDVQSGATTKTGKTIQLTDDNKVRIEEMIKEGFNPYELISTFTEEQEEEN